MKVELIEAAQRIAALVRACRDEGERERRLPARVLAAMHEARLFRMHIPKALDGLEIDPITSMIVVEAGGKQPAGVGAPLAERTTVQADVARAEALTLSGRSAVRERGRPRGSRR